MKKISSENIFIHIGDKGRHGDNDKHKVGEDARVREKNVPFFANKVLLPENLNNELAKDQDERGLCRLHA